MKFDDSKEDLIEIVQTEVNKGSFDCRLIGGYEKDCLNKVLPKLLGVEPDKPGLNKLYVGDK